MKKHYRLNKKKFTNFCLLAVSFAMFMALNINMVFAVFSPKW